MTSLIQSELYTSQYNAEPCFLHHAHLNVSLLQLQMAIPEGPPFALRREIYRFEVIFSSISSASNFAPTPDISLHPAEFHGLIWYHMICSLVQTLVLIFYKVFLLHLLGRRHKDVTLEEVTVQNHSTLLSAIMDSSELTTNESLSLFHRFIFSSSSSILLFHPAACWIIS